MAATASGNQAGRCSQPAVCIAQANGALTSTGTTLTVTAATATELARLLAAALQRFGPIKGSWLAVRRLFRCHPWNPGGVDHVPERAGSEHITHAH